MILYGTLAAQSASAIASIVGRGSRLSMEAARYTLNCLKSILNDN